MQVINQTMEADIPQHIQANISLGRKLKSLLMVIAKSVPFKPVMQKLAEATGISRNDIPNYLIYMEKAGMIAQLRDTTGGIRGLGKVEKLYLDNTNLIYTLAPEQAEIGNVRETFFMNQTRVANEVTSSSLSDFEINGKVFEIGGRKKGQKQIESAQEGYIVKDDIENGYANRKRTRGIYRERRYRKRLRQHHPPMGFRAELLVPSHSSITSTSVIT